MKLNGAVDTKSWFIAVTAKWLYVDHPTVLLKGKGK